MDAKMLTEALDYLFKADVPAFIWGAHGKGKSSIPKQWCQKNGWMLFDLRLNTQSDVGDILGLQDFLKDSKGNIYATKHFSPEWLVSAIKFCEENPDKGTVIFFDEVNRAARLDMVGPIFQMVLDKRLHTINFPPNLKFLSAGNYNTDDYQTLSLTDKALMDRFLHINFTPSRKEFFDYSNETKVHPTILGFLKETPAYLEEDNLAEFSINDIAKPSRRTWGDYANRLMNLEPPKEMLAELITGLVGPTISIAFSKYQENEVKPLSAADIMKNYKKHQKNIQALINKTPSRTDLYKLSADNLREALLKLEAPLTTKEGKNIVDFWFDGPIDFTISELQKVAHVRNVLVFFETNNYRASDIEAIFKLRQEVKG